MSMPVVSIIGAGLAGTEAAWQVAQCGISVNLFEMRPGVTTGAHETSYLAELICSNSLGSNLPNKASGVLKNELRRLNSLLIDCAEAASVPAGSALAVDRNLFAKIATERIKSHPRIKIIRQEVTEIPAGPVIISSGPLTSASLSKAISSITGEEFLYFYDALAPIVYRDTVNMEIAFHGSRYGIGENEGGDYINCPMNEMEYQAFIEALLEAKRTSIRGFETDIAQAGNSGGNHLFEGCLPIEVIAKRGLQSLAFGPLRPVGLKDPRTKKGGYAVVQLRQDNLAGSLYNLVGFQTNLTFSEQKRVFRMIPGLERAEFVRYGQMHRNTFIASPVLLLPSLQFKNRKDIFFAGQLIGVEGYMGNIATGVLAGKNISRIIKGQPTISLPVDTIIGSLCQYITHTPASNFQPMKANFGLLPPLDKQYTSRSERSWLYANRAQTSLESFLSAMDWKK
jgi:methylenetetrahydrofolate--tRNA-(uracil-5-)-methyltransferase